jgi:hypothetical protein
MLYGFTTTDIESFFGIIDRSTTRCFCLVAKVFGDHELGHLPNKLNC